MSKEQQKLIFVGENVKENGVENVPPLKSFCLRQPLDLHMPFCWFCLRHPSSTNRLIACSTFFTNVLISIAMSNHFTYL
jgi:hypothetical protein